MNKLKANIMETYGGNEYKDFNMNHIWNIHISYMIRSKFTSKRKV